MRFRSREDLPRILNERGLLGTAVEIGVHVGWHAYHFRAAWKGRLFIGVDPWRVYAGADSDQSTHDEYYEHAKRAMAGYGDSAMLIRSTSAMVAEIMRRQILDLRWHGRNAFEREAETLLDSLPTIPGLEFVDFVYLDGAHHYESVRDDIAAWWPLIRSGGIMAGHDHIPDGWHVNNDPVNTYATREEALRHGPGVAEFGVQRAVKAFFGDEAAIELSDTDQDNGYRSWAAVKP